MNQHNIVESEQDVLSEFEKSLPRLRDVDSVFFKAWKDSHVSRSDGWVGDNFRRIRIQVNFSKFL